jgi:hypothetical protein
LVNIRAWCCNNKRIQFCNVKSFFAHGIGCNQNTFAFTPFCTLIGFYVSSKHTCNFLNVQGKHIKQYFGVIDSIT